MLLHCHCERPTGACLHTEVLRFSTQAWQSHHINKRLLRRFTPRNDALLNAFVLVILKEELHRMPIFEFRCSRCGKEFEELILPSDPKPCCPQCQCKEVDKLLSAFSFSSKGASSDAVSTSASGSGGCSSCSSKSCSTCR